MAAAECVREDEMKSLIERDLEYFSSLDDIYWQEESRKQLERIRRTEEEDGYCAPEEAEA